MGEGVIGESFSDWLGVTHVIAAMTAKNRLSKQGSPRWPTDPPVAQTQQLSGRTAKPSIHHVFIQLMTAETLKVWRMSSEGGKGAFKLFSTLAHDPIAELLGSTQPWPFWWHSILDWFSQQPQAVLPTKGLKLTYYVRKWVDVHSFAVFFFFFFYHSEAFGLRKSQAQTFLAMCFFVSQKRPLSHPVI